MLLDLLFVTIILLCVIWGVKRGIIKTALAMSSVLVSIIAALLLYNPFMDIICANPSVAAIIDVFKESVTQAVLPTLKIDLTDKTPAILSYIIDSDTISQGSMAIASSIAEAVVYLITIVVFIILIKLVVSSLFKVFKVAAKLPVIKQANGLMGGLMGLVAGVFVCWIAAAVLTMFIGQEGFGWVSESMETSRLAAYIFKSNIILKVIK